MPLTEERMREIVREENLRLLRVNLTIAEHMRHGWIVGPSLLDTPKQGDTIDRCWQAVIDYREGR